MNTTGKQFVDFWSWAAKKGLMNENTANSFSTPVRKIISVNENWENLDIAKLDLEDLITRFKNIKGKDLKPISLNAYIKRFKLAWDLFLQYVDNPTGWKFSGQQSSTLRKPKQSKTDKSQTVDDEYEMPITTRAGSSIATVDYPFPLRENCVVRLKLPTDLKVSEVERLAAFMRTLTID